MNKLITWALWGVGVLSVLSFVACGEKEKQTTTAPGVDIRAELFEMVFDPCVQAVARGTELPPQVSPEEVAEVVKLMLMPKFEETISAVEATVSKIRDRETRMKFYDSALKACLKAAGIK